MLKQRDFDRIRQRHGISRRELAGPETPFIHDCWYVAARAAEVDRSPKALRLLGISVVMFRDSEGRVRALQDRCGHRSFPLSEGTLDGDELVCRYHGLRYGMDGVCVGIPGQDEVRGRFGVRSFPVRERGSFVWIWMGAAERADESEPPVPDWLDHPDWDIQVGYVIARGSYVHLHENLLDLSHLSYLHASTFGTPEYALAPVEITIEPDDIQVWRHVKCVLPGLYADALGWQGQQAMRRSGSQLVTPALHVNTGIFENLELERQPEPTPMVKVAQLITPETQYTTHYHYALCRNFATDDPGVSETMLKGLTAAFTEDLVAIEHITDLIRGDPADTVFEYDIPTDRAGIEMRRRFKRWADAEA